MEIVDVIEAMMIDLQVLAELVSVEMEIAYAHPLVRMYEARNVWAETPDREGFTMKTETKAENNTLKIRIERNV